MEHGRINHWRAMVAALMLALVVVFGSAAPVLAAEKAAKNITLTVGESVMQVDDKEVSIADGVPEINGNRVYIPLRAVTEAFGAEVNYDSASGDITITNDDYNVVMNTMASVYTVNGTLKWMDMAPFVNADSRTMVPVRFVSDGLGYVIDVNGEGTGAVVTISRNDA
ncbi:MAG: copper amine oxidase N-terminal domain-containing protein [Peptococcaceae bacterium]|nr:copper amine oxidase N-terminal domain-containing protein [Peptococcaceae bacterium]